MNTTTDKTKEQIRQERHERLMKAQAEEQKFRENLANDLMNDYGFSQKIAELVVGKGWMDGHAFGYEEIRSCAYDIADFVEQILQENEKDN